MRFHLGWFVCFLAVSALGQGARGAPVFFAPQPYLSTDDSPFLGRGGTFFLEDFEDGQLNTPGVSAPNFFLHAPSVTTGSVDADDGAVDGSGAAGHALSSGVIIAGMSYPPLYQSGLGIEFDRDELGFWPTEVGFVWTGSGSNFLGFVVVDAAGVTAGTITTSQLMSGPDDSGTSQDRFFGVKLTEGISKIFLYSSIRDINAVGEDSLFSIDHLQYGASGRRLLTPPSSAASVPEPGSLFLFSVGCAGIACAARWRVGRRAIG